MPAPAPGGSRPLQNNGRGGRGGTWLGEWGAGPNTGPLTPAPPPPSFAGPGPPAVPNGFGAEPPQPQRAKQPPPQPPPWPDASTPVGSPPGSPPPAGRAAADKRRHGDPGSLDVPSNVARTFSQGSGRAQPEGSADHTPKPPSPRHSGRGRDPDAHSHVSFTGVAAGPRLRQSVRLEEPVTPASPPDRDWARGTVPVAKETRAHARFGTAEPPGDTALWSPLQLGAGPAHGTAPQFRNRSRSILRHTALMQATESGGERLLPPEPMSTLAGPTSTFGPRSATSETHTPLSGRHSPGLENRRASVGGAFPGSPASPARARAENVAFGALKARLAAGKIKGMVNKQKGRDATRKPEHPDAIVVRSLIVMYLRQARFQEEMEFAFQEMGAVNKERFAQVWMAAVGTAAIDALRDFQVFRSDHVDRAEQTLLAEAVFDLVDLDGSDSVDSEEFQDFISELSTITDSSQNPQSEEPSAPQQQTQPQKQKDKEKAAARKKKLLMAVHGTITQMQRHAVSLGIPPQCRKKFEAEFPEPPKREHGQEWEKMLESYQYIYKDPRVFRTQIKEGLEKWKADIPKIWVDQLKEDVDSDLWPLDTEFLRAIFKDATGADLCQARVDHMFHIYSGKIPVCDLRMNCSRDPLQLSDSFNLAFAKQMRRRAYDFIALAFYLFALATTVVFFVEHEGSGRMPGDVFQTVAIDELLAHEELPGYMYRKTFFDTETVEAYWEWIYGPVLTLLWPRNGDQGVNGTAAHTIARGSQVIGGVRLRQARAPRIRCELQAGLINHGKEINICPDADMTLVEERFSPHCFEDLMVGGMMGGGSVLQGASERDSYWVGLNGTSAANQSTEWCNQFCTESEMGVVDKCEPKHPAIQIPRKTVWDEWVRAGANVSLSLRNCTAGNATAAEAELGQAQLVEFLEPWMYHSCQQLGSEGVGIFGGRFGISNFCDGYGMVIPIEWRSGKVKHLFDTLSGNGWIDGQTASVHLEFFTYNRHTGLFQRFQFVVDFTAGGLPIPSRDVTSFGLFDYARISGGYIFFAVLALANLFGIALVRVRVYVHKYRRRVKLTPGKGHQARWRAVLTVLRSNRIWVIDLCTIILSFLVILLKLIWAGLGLTDSCIYCTDRWPAEYERPAHVQRLTNLISAFTIAWLFLGVCYRLRTFKNARMLFDTLALASTDIIVICTMATLIFVSLGVAAWLVYSQTTIEYASLSHTLLELFKSMLGDFEQMKQLERDRRSFAPLFFLLFQAISVMCLLNMIIAVFTNSLAKVQSTRYDGSEFIRRINNDPATRFPPAHEDGLLNWTVKMPGAVLDELRLLFCYTRMKLRPRGNYTHNWYTACEKSNRKFWEEYVMLLEMLERGDSQQVIAATLVIGAVVHKFSDKTLTELRGAARARQIIGVFGTVHALSADDLLDKELSPGRRKEAESLLVLIPHAFLHRPQVRLWMDVLHVHDRWRRDAQQWSSTVRGGEDPNATMNRTLALAHTNHVAIRQLREDLYRISLGLVQLDSNLRWVMRAVDAQPAAEAHDVAPISPTVASPTTAFAGPDRGITFGAAERGMTFGVDRGMTHARLSRAWSEGVVLHGIPSSKDIESETATLRDHGMPSVSRLASSQRSVLP
eukprot:TRINITY_DN25767_c0_g1_i1.p1 TRINITY_DN25767_c0_g1~~TRINITY_DN25767_c0_g1_i1.p1  ORF type:complete len:1647 (+),score=544.70 TRINITY_DN25767_c0_g1_i1:104-4942(+)